MILPCSTLPKDFPSGLEYNSFSSLWLSRPCLAWLPSTAESPSLPSAHSATLTFLLFLNRPAWFHLCSSCSLSLDTSCPSSWVWSLCCHLSRIPQPTEMYTAGSGNFSVLLMLVFTGLEHPVHWGKAITISWIKNRFTIKKKVVICCYPRELEMTERNCCEWTRWSFGQRFPGLCPVGVGVLAGSREVPEKSKPSEAREVREFWESFSEQVKSTKDWPSVSEGGHSGRRKEWGCKTHCPIQNPLSWVTC